MSVANKLRNAFTKYIDKDVTRKKWEPDYIVIAGDVKDAKEEKEEKYGDAEKFIKALRESFNIDRNHVIIVPGNHDKDAKISEEQMRTDKDVFNKYSGDCRNNKKDFGDIFEPRFKDFINFISPYSNELQFKNCILDERLRGLSGVKVFDDDHLCFLYVNTEWLYYPDRDKAMVLSPGVKNITEFVRIDEDCQLCAPLIKDAFDLIKEKYKDYTVITVMHRGFEHFSYKEKNVSNKTTIDAIGDILQISDVIITGHDHVFSPAPPTLLRNRVQHFQLGATGIKENPTKEILRFAEIIRLDLSGEKVEQLILEYAKDPDNGDSWRFKRLKEEFPLFSKFIPRKETLKIRSNTFGKTVLRVRAFCPDDIKRAIDTYFNQDSIIISTDDRNTLKDRMESIVSIRANEMCYIVIYYDFNMYLSDNRTNGSDMSDIEQQLDDFRERHITEIMMGKIIINEVLIEYPLLDIEKESVVSIQSDGSFLGRRLLGVEKEGVARIQNEE